MRIGQTRMVVKEDGRVNFPGIDWSSRRIELATPIKLNDGVVAVRFSPGSYYGGQGRPQKYSPACIRVFRIVEEIAGAVGHFIVDDLIEIPVRADDARRHASDYFDQPV